MSRMSSSPNTPNDVPRQIIIPDGCCGSVEVCGTYVHDGYHRRACKYVRTGSVGEQQHHHQQRRVVKFSIYQQRMGSDGDARYWFLTRRVVQTVSTPGFSPAKVLYAAPVTEHCIKIPPATGWTVYNNFMYGGIQYGVNPPPQLSLIWNVPSQSENHTRDARESLETSERELLKHMRNADMVLRSLRSDQDKVEREIDVAERRLAKITKVTERLCDDCFRLLPVLIATTDVSSFYNNTEDDSQVADDAPHRTCVSCGKLVDQPYIKVSVPPLVSTSIQAADRALRYHTNPQQPQRDAGEVGGIKFHHTTSPWHSRQWMRPLTTDPITTTNNNNNNNNNMPSLSKLARKVDYLYAARESFKTAEQNLEYIKDAIHQWTVYRREHKKKVDEIRSTLLEADDRSRKATVLPKCIICQDRPKELVFQCGHQCCAPCAERLTTCHTCRVQIVQRIKLYD